MPKSPYLSLIERPPEGLRIGVVTQAPDGAAIHPEVVMLIEQVAYVLEAFGHHVSAHSMTLDATATWKTYTDMTCVETAAMFDYLATVVGHPVTPEEVEPITWAIIERGRAMSATDHAGRVEQVRQIGRAVAQDLDPFDITLTPVLTQPPRPVGFYDMAMTDLDAYNALWSDSVFMSPFNMSGQPAISLPLGEAGGAPCGVQLVARMGDEARLLALSAALEMALPWADRRPPAVTGGQPGA